MPRKSGTTFVNKFINGLITDSTVLNSPKDSCTETDNCIFAETGKVTRRKGFDFEVGRSDNAKENVGLVTEVYVWKEVNGDGTQNLLVVQVGTILCFYDLSEEVISSGIFGDTVDLTDHDVTSTPLADLGAQRCQFTHGLGKLFVVHPNVEPFFVTADLTNRSSGITETAIAINIRDLVGVDDSLAVDNRPTATVASVTDTHHYNLYNQGWYYNSAAHLDTWDAARTDMPSNADIWWVFRDTVAAAFDVSTISERNLGNTPAPKGHFILTAFDQQRDAVSAQGWTLTDVTTGLERPRTVQFHAGRVWYAGTKAAGHHTRLYFSQLMLEVGQAGNCHTFNDPTSEELRDVLPTDGGYLDIQGAGTVWAIREMGNALLVFASQGVWAITGSDGIGFTATNFAVDKISSIPVTNHSSLVEIEASWSWWNDQGIWQVSRNDQGQFQVQSMTDNKIRNHILDNVPSLSRKQVKGVYNAAEKCVEWLYRSVEGTEPEHANDYDRVLNLNLLSGAFFVWSVQNTSSTTVELHAPFVFQGFPGDANEVQVVDSTPDTVRNNADDTDVIVFNVQGSSGSLRFKYVVSHITSGRQYTIGTNINENYIDWAIYDDGTNYTSSFITEYTLPTEGLTYAQSQYIIIYLETLTNSGGKVQALWDWTNTTDSNRWSALQTIYPATLPYTGAALNRNANYKRLKLRGKGRSLRLRFESESGKPFEIVGWAQKLTANADV